MAIREQQAVIEFVEEATSPIRLYSSTVIATATIHILAVEQEQETLICSVKSQELLHNAMYAIIKFDKQKWRVKRLMKLYGSPNYDIELICERLI